MLDDATALIRQERRAARRLARLFRIERTGRLARRSDEVSARIIERRGLLVAELARLEARRQSLAPWTTVELDVAMGGLAKEVERGEQRCLELLAELGVELARRRGGVTGLRDGTEGRLLGRG
jgi:hypothetical protein